ncbi:MAG: histidine kinase [Oligoflexia bacterium]|nr:histidine kinase [Oligoflexia bacterium]
MKPFISIIILVSVALSTVFVKMEVVRLGYEILSMGRKTKQASEARSRLEVQYAKLTRPSRLDKIGTEKLALTRVQKNQVIMMAAQGELAVRQ